MKKIIITILLIGLVCGAYLFINKKSSVSNPRNITSISDISLEDRELVAEAIARSSMIMKSGDIDEIRELMIKKAGDDNTKIASIKRTSDNSLRSLSSFASGGTTITKDMVLQSTNWSVTSANKVVVKVKTGEHTVSSFDAVYNGGWY